MFAAVEAGNEAGKFTDFRRTKMEGYCMKCKEKREIKDVKPVTMKNGKPANEGTCPVCGTKIFKIGAAK